MKSICKQVEQAEILRDGSSMKLRTDVLGQVVGSIEFSSFKVAVFVLRFYPSPSVCCDRYRVEKPAFSHLVFTYIFSHISRTLLLAGPIFYDTF